MLCTVSCRAQPIHSFKLIIHLDDTVQRLIISANVPRIHILMHRFFWLDFGINTFMLLLKVVFLLSQSEIIQYENQAKPHETECNKKLSFSMLFNIFLFIIPFKQYNIIACCMKKSKDNNLGQLKQYQASKISFLLKKNTMHCTVDQAICTFFLYTGVTKCL